jgi:hypothetical protein
MIIRITGYLKKNVKEFWTSCQMNKSEVNARQRKQRKQEKQESLERQERQRSVKI